MSTHYKGIVLAGGTGTRLHPITKGVSKHLLPVYDKPMIYYPISVLMLAGIQEILLISTPDDIPGYQRLLSDGSDFGIRIDYAIQPSPGGLAQAFLTGEEFIGDGNVTLILGDNIFYGQNFAANLKAASSKTSGATIFAYQVKDPERFGVVNFDSNGIVSSIEEKPKNPTSNFAITGLYFYDNDVIEIAKSIRPSSRGELEITDINKAYQNKGVLEVALLNQDFTWLDTGTHDALMKAGGIMQAIENHEGLKVACLEEIAFLQGWITKDMLLQQADILKKTPYGEYLTRVAGEYK